MEVPLRLETMRRLWGVAFVAFVALSTSSLGATEAQPTLLAKGPTKKAGKGSAKAKAKEAEDDSGKDGKAKGPGRSTRARASTDFMVVGEIALLDFLHAGQGAEVGYFLSPDTLLEVGAMHATFEFFDFKSTQTLLTVDWHHFVGNSFYVFAGAGMRMMEATSSDFVLSSSSEEYVSTHANTSVVAQGGIGNRWQWDSGFTLGCDWVGYAYPVAELSRSSSYEGEPSEEEQAESQADFDARATAGTLVAVRFHLGFAF